MLNSHINGYRMLRLGTIKKGDVEQGRIGGIAKKLS
jgi:hypothetical protein